MMTIEQYLAEQKKKLNVIAYADLEYQCKIGPTKNRYFKRWCEAHNIIYPARQYTITERK